MHWYFVALLIAALSTLIAAWDLPRAKEWIGAGSLSFLLSSVWWDLGWPYGAAFGAFTDFVIIALLYAFGKRNWEIRLANTFQAMVLIDVLWLFRLTPSHYWYATALELCNWAALITIFIAGTTEKARGHGYHFWGAHSGVLDRVGAHLSARRKHPPFWKV